MTIRFQHLQKINQTYLQHFKDAVSYSYVSQKASLYFILHALYPDMFMTNGSSEIAKLHEQLQKKNNRLSDK